MFKGQVIWSHFKDWFCPVKLHVIGDFWQKNIHITALQRRMWPPKKKADSAGRTSKRRSISEETVIPRNDEIHDLSTTDPAMLQSITAAVTKSVLGELQKAGIIASQSKHDGQIQHDT